MHQAHAILTFETQGKGLLEITHDIASWLRSADIGMGTVTLFCQHTSASLMINENAAPAVTPDLIRWLYKSAHQADGNEHDPEGPYENPAHIKAMLTGNSLTIPFADGKMLLGSWQGIYLAEHRDVGSRGYVVAHAMGD